MNTPSLRLSCAFLLALTLVSPLARAATITWGSPTDITGNSDVSTNGSLVGAFNVGTTGVSATTVNGVNFQSFAVSPGGGTVGNFAITPAGVLSFGNTAFGSAAPPFSTLSPEYQTLLAAATSSGSPFTLTISGLIVGMQYEFQWWANLSRADSLPFGQHSATAGNPVTLSDNVSMTEGGLGQFAIGAFTADAATQSIIFSGPSFGLLNGFQLRQTGPAGVPENGSTLVLFALALGALALVRCRRTVAKG